MTISVSELSGDGDVVVRLQLPLSLQRQWEEWATAEGMSVGEFIVGVLAHSKGVSYEGVLQEAVESETVAAADSSDNTIPDNIVLGYN
jgi:hypothetical protein